MTAPSSETLREIAPRFVTDKQRGSRQAAIIDAIGPTLLETLGRYEILAPLRVAHFLAQTCHESAGFSTIEEVPLPQSPHFEQYDPGTRKGRLLGNTLAGDGERFKGRGLIQLTGRANYTFYDGRLGLGLIDHPERAADPSTALVIACEYWKCRELNTFADWDDALTVTYLINGGFGGLGERRVYLQKAKTALAIAASDPPGHPAFPLRPGDKGAGVKSLQVMLGRIQGGVGADGEFGPATGAAVLQFQERNGMSADGVVGPETWTMLCRQAGSN
jgi:putative chitinase